MVFYFTILQLLFHLLLWKKDLKKTDDNTFPYIVGIVLVLLALVALSGSSASFSLLSPAVRASALSAMGGPAVPSAGGPVAPAKTFPPG